MTEAYVPDTFAEVKAGFLEAVPLTARSVASLPLRVTSEFPSPGSKKLDANGLPLALQYPGHRPEDSFSLLGDQVIPGHLLEASPQAPPRFYVKTANETESAGVYDIDDLLRQAEVPTLGERFPVVAFGSNANPGQLQQKFTKLGSGDRDIVPTLKATVSRLVPVYAARIGINGYVFTDIVSSCDPGVTSDVHVNFLSRKQLEAMDATEKAYRFCKLDRIQIHTGQDETVETSAYIYLGRTDNDGANLLADDKGRLIRLAEITTRGGNLRGEFGVMTQSAVQRYIFDIAGRAIATALLIDPEEAPIDELEVIEIITKRRTDPRLNRFREVLDEEFIAQPLGRMVGKAIQRAIASSGRTINGNHRHIDSTKLRPICVSDNLDPFDRLRLDKA